MWPVIARGRQRSSAKMSLSVLRRGVSSLCGRGGRSLLAPSALRPAAAATIVSKAMRPEGYQRPAPFDYENTSYGLIAAIMDKTTHRFDENSKIVVVEGPIAAGKTQFAKDIAAELDMKYVPGASMDQVYTNAYGFDMRTLDPQLPVDTRSFVEKDFLANPTHRNVASMQFKLFYHKLEQYIDALAHVLSTGQGVVMERCVYSDFVFLETMAHFGYISKEAASVYYECKQQTVPELMRPHLVIYLDMPVSAVMDKIKQRNLPHEVNSPVLSEAFLTKMEAVYKQQYLKQISAHSELLVYDWTLGGDTEVVVEDIERLPFEFDKNDPKLADWRHPNEWAWCTRRMQFTYHKNQILHWMNVPNFSAPELVITAEDYKIFHDVWFNAPGMRYQKGFNANMGDQFLLTKT